MSVSEVTRLSRSLRLSRDVCGAATVSARLVISVVFALVFFAGSGTAWAALTPSWTGQQVISGSGTSADPIMAVLNGQLFAMWKGTGLDTGLYWSSSNGTTWTGQQQIGNVGSSEGPGLAAFNGRLYAMWKGSFDDSGVYWASSSGS